MAQDFMKQTLLRAEYAIECLAAAGWNLTKAWNAYLDRKMKNMIPVEAWTKPPM